MNKQLINKYKPDEPKFKVGDFVKFTDISNKHPKQIIKIEDEVAYTEFNKCLLTQLILWAPVKDEWCWFWDKCTPHRPTLRQYDIFPEGYGEDNMFHDSEQNPFDFCEPFLNSLPSYLKDK